MALMMKTISDGDIISLIAGARERISLYAPGVSESVADALCEAAWRLDGNVTIALDISTKSIEMGFLNVNAVYKLWHVKESIHSDLMGFYTIEGLRLASLFVDGVRMLVYPAFAVNFEENNIHACQICPNAVELGSEVFHVQEVCEDIAKIPVCAKLLDTVCGKSANTRSRTLTQICEKQKELAREAVRLQYAEMVKVAEAKAAKTQDDLARADAEIKGLKEQLERVRAEAIKEHESRSEKHSVESSATACQRNGCNPDLTSSEYLTKLNAVQPGPKACNPHFNNVDKSPREGSDSGKDSEDLAAQFSLVKRKLEKHNEILWGEITASGRSQNLDGAKDALRQVEKLKAMIETVDRLMSDCATLGHVASAEAVPRATAGQSGSELPARSNNRPGRGDDDEATSEDMDAESWIRCEMVTCGVTRHQAIEKYLKQDHGEYINCQDAELLAEWLNGNDTRFKVKYEGGFVPDYLSVDRDADNRVIGFKWQLEEDICRSCDEDYGYFSVEILGYKFEHFGVSYFNEDMWNTVTWGGKTHELSDAIDQHILIPHIEDYIDEVKWRDYHIECAFEHDWKNGDFDDWVFARDKDGNVYAFEGYRDEGAYREFGVNVPLNVEGGLPKELEPITEKLAIELLEANHLPFENNLCR